MTANAASVRQVKSASRRERDARERETADLRYLLKDEVARRFLWRLLSRSGMYQDPTHARGDMTHQNIGRSEMGRWLLSEIVDANEESYFTMMREAQAAKRAQENEQAAVELQSQKDDPDEP